MGRARANSNTATGYQAAVNNSTGAFNTASGYQALHQNTSGAQNTASGVNAAQGNKTGDFNTATGTDALFANTAGSSNIADYKAGYLTTGSNNIDIGNEGARAEADTIRIGTAATHKATYIAGIVSATVTGSAVVVSASGHSRRSELFRAL